MALTAKSLILDLLLAARGTPLSTRNAVLACGLFGLTPGNVRVALGRLSAAGLIEAAGRGSYRLGAGAQELAGDIATWREIEARLGPWDGSYVVVHSAGLGRTDRAALRRRERALELLGFRELERGLHIRPNNLDHDIEGLRRRAHALGLEPAASLFRAEGFDTARQQRIETLWDDAELSRHYQQLERQMSDWLARSEQLETDVAAREAFLLGRRAIRQVVYDPMLPAPMIDEQARAAFFAKVREFDRIGHQLWQRLYQNAATPQPRPNTIITPRRLQ